MKLAINVLYGIIRRYAFSIKDGKKWQEIRLETFLSMLKSLMWIFQVF